MFFVFFVPLRNPRVEVPAVIIERPALSSLLNELLNVVFVFLFKVEKAHHHVGNLDAGVVDVILYIHVAAGRTQQTYKGVAQDRITQVADMRSLVWVDAGVLDQDLFSFARKASLRFQKKPRSVLAVNSRVDVTGTGDFKFLKAFHFAQRDYDFFRDLARRLP